LPRFGAKVLVTNRRIVLLDRNNDLAREKITFRKRRFLVPGRLTPNRDGDLVYVRPHKELVFGSNRYPEGGQLLDPFWTLTRAANRCLYEEFRRNPSGFSKGPLLAAWWFHGYRRWTWVTNVRREESDAHLVRNSVEPPRKDLVFTLELAEASSYWGPGQQRPGTHPLGTVRFRFPVGGMDEKGQREINKLKEQIVGLAEGGAAFTDEFLTNLPSKPVTKGYVAYANVVWVAFAEAIPVGVLWAFHAPLWVTLPVCVGVGWLAVRLVKRLRARTESGHGFMSTREERLKVFMWIGIGAVAFAVLPFIVFLFAALVGNVAPRTQPPPRNVPREQGVNPGTVKKLLPTIHPPTPEPEQLVVASGTVWLGFANGTGVRDREAELVRNCGAFTRVDVPDTAGNKLSDLCAYRNQSCVRVCDWEGRMLPCDSVSLGGRRDATRVVLCGEEAPSTGQK
jgi:hypothetical protein